MRLSYNFSSRFILLLIFILVNVSVFAHGDLTIRIKEKTAEILKDPNNAELYLQRGFLYQQHDDYNKAISDYEKSEDLGLKNKLIYYRKAETFYKAKTFNKALSSAEQYFKLDSVDIKIYKLKAQILFELKRFDKAQHLYDYVLENTLDLRPYNIIEYCNIILSIDNTNYNKAIDALNFGIEKLGKHTFSLQLKKLEYLKSSKQTEEAINQFNYFILNNNRKEFWYYKKAKYLLDINEFVAAKTALLQAKKSVDTLHQKFKSTPSIKNLQEKIQLLDLKLNQK